MRNTYPQYHRCWWFDNYLPEPYRSQAIENTSQALNIEKDSLVDSLVMGFSWYETPQGHKYWESLFLRVEAGEFNQPQP